MLRRISEHQDPQLLREVLLRPRLEAAPRTGLGLPSLTVGRHPSNDVVLQSSGIPLLLSRFHSVVTFDGEQFTVVDKSNTNGTYVRARACSHAPAARACVAECAPRGRAGRVCALQPLCALSAPRRSL